METQKHKFVSQYLWKLKKHEFVSQYLWKLKKHKFVSQYLWKLYMYLDSNIYYSFSNKVVYWKNLKNENLQ